MYNHKNTASALPAAHLPHLPPRGRQSYWHPELLRAFTLHMAGHGLPVSESMMLGDPVYARAQLRMACALDDHALQQLGAAMLNTLGHPATGVGGADGQTQWTH